MNHNTLYKSLSNSEQTKTISFQSDLKAFSAMDYENNYLSILDKSSIQKIILNNNIFLYNEYFNKLIIEDSLENSQTIIPIYLLNSKNKGTTIDFETTDSGSVILKYSDDKFSTDYHFYSEDNKISNLKKVKVFTDDKYMFINDNIETEINLNKDLEIPENEYLSNVDYFIDTNSNINASEKNLLNFSNIKIDNKEGISIDDRSFIHEDDQINLHFSNDKLIEGIFTNEDILQFGVAGKTIIYQESNDFVGFKCDGDVIYISANSIIEEA